ncbi:HYR domain-containing protein, partial [Hyunsoonleella aestuarii]
MKTNTYKVFQNFAAILIFFGVFGSYGQDNSCIILDNCPADITVCADANMDGSSGPPFDGAIINWNTPDVSQTCSGGTGNGNFNMLFELNEQLLTEDCWDFNYISRVGTDGGYVKLFSGNDGDGDDKSKIQTPFLIIEDDTTVSIDVEYSNGNYDVQLFLVGGLDNFGNPYPDVQLSAQTVNAGQATYSWNADFDSGDGSVTGVTGVYRLLFVFSYTGSKPNNANQGDTVIAIEGFLSDDGCSAGIDFTVSAPNQGYYPIGVHDLEYVATYTSPSGEIITKSCSFTVTVVGLQVTATGTDVSCSGETDGQITVQGSGGINGYISGYVLRNSSNQVIGIYSMPVNNPNQTHTFTPENTGQPIGSGTYTIEYDQSITGIGVCQATTTVVIGTDPDTTPPHFSSCPSDITVSSDANLCSAIVNWIGPIAGDNCDIASITSNFNSGSTFPLGTTTVTYTVTDGVGLTGTCSFDVTVEDNVDPTAICQDITVQLDASGNASITAAQIDNGSNDACGI